MKKKRRNNLLFFYLLNLFAKLYINAGSKRVINSWDNVTLINKPHFTTQNSIKENLHGREKRSWTSDAWQRTKYH